MAGHQCLFFESTQFPMCTNPAKRIVRDGVPTLCWAHYRPKCRTATHRAKSRQENNNNKKIRAKRTLCVKRVPLSKKRTPKICRFEDLTFMPNMTKGRKTYLFNRHVAECKKPACHPTSWEEISVLFESIKLYGVGYDPCAGTGTLARGTLALNPNVTKVHTRDVDKACIGLDSYGDSLSVAVPPDVDFLIMSPPFRTADLWLGWGVAQNLDVLVFHLAGDNFSNSYDSRKSLFAPYLNNNLMHVVEGLPLVKGRKMRRCSFIVLFKEGCIRNKCLKQGKYCRVYHNKYNQV